MSLQAFRKTNPDGSVLEDRTFRAVYEFLALESDCLGCGDLPAWYALLAPQIRYRVMAPAFMDAARPRHYGRGTPYFDDDADSLAIRVRQLSTPSFTIAENPPTIARHFVTNIRAARTDEGIEALSNVLVLHPSVKANSVKEVIALAKAQPGKIPYASSGNGTSIHMSGAMFTQMTAIDMIHILDPDQCA